MGSLPNDWTSANVVPVYKKEDRRIAANYRPISLTSIVKLWKGSSVSSLLLLWNSLPI